MGRNLMAEGPLRTLEYGPAHSRPTHPLLLVSPGGLRSWHLSRLPCPVFQDTAQWNDEDSDCQPIAGTGILALPLPGCVT